VLDAEVPPVATAVLLPVLALVPPVLVDVPPPTPVLGPEPLLLLEQAMASKPIATNDMTFR
jgi:hypothetical protein